MLIKKLLILLLLLSLLGCETITGEKAVESAKIRQSEAIDILRNYARTQGVDWGEPAFMKIVPPKYIFEYHTPVKEIPTLGGRIIMVDMNTGEVTIPPRL